MNKVGFVMSSILMFFGIVLVAWGQVIKSLLPKIGYIVFKLHGPGSYSPSEYVVNLSGLYIIATISIIVGLLFSVIFYKKGSKQK